MAADWPWMRLYAEARTDAKLRVLTDAEHRVWFNLLCYASEQPTRGEIHTCDRFTLAVECANGDEELLAETLTKLSRLQIVRVTSRDRRDMGVTPCDMGVITFLAWEKRQYDKPSDRSEATAERKRRQREKAHRDAKTPHPPSNKEGVSRDVTRSHAPELDTEIEREREKNVSNTTCSHPPAGPSGPQRGAYTVAFEEFWKAYPRTNGSKSDAFKAWKHLSGEDRGAAIVALPAWLGCAQWREGYVKHAGSWLRGRLWEVAPASARASPQRAGGPRNGQPPEQRRPAVPRFDDIRHRYEKGNGG